MHFFRPLKVTFFLAVYNFSISCQNYTRLGQVTNLILFHLDIITHEFCQPLEITKQTSNMTVQKSDSHLSTKNAVIFLQKNCDDWTLRLVDLSLCIAQYLSGMSDAPILEMWGLWYPDTSKQSKYCAVSYPMLQF